MKGKGLIIIISVVVLLLAGGGAGWFFLQKSSAKEKELSADDILATMVEVQPISTNLKSGGFIQLSFKIQTSSKEAKEELEKRDFQVRNTALHIITAMTQEQVTSSDGMKTFEEDMKKELNKLMQEGSIVQVYTTNKMVQ